MSTFGLLAYVAILSGLFVATLRRPAVSIAAVLLMYSLEQWGQASHPILLKHVTFTNYSVGIIVVSAVAVRVLRGQNLFSRYPKVVWLIVALLGYALLSTLWSPYSDKVYAIWIAAAPYIGLMIGLAPIVWRDERDLSAAFGAFFVCGLPLLACLLFFVEWDNRMIVLSRAGGVVYGNPLEVGTMAASLLVVGMLYKPDPRGSRMNQKIWGLLRAPTLVGAIALIVISGARGQLFGAVVACIVLWPMVQRVRSPARFVAWGVVASIVGGAVYIAIEGLGEENIRWSAERINQDIAGRFSNSVNLIAAWLSSAPSIVIGLGNSASYKIAGIYPHNVPVEVLCEEGLIGAAIYTTILLSILKAIRRGLRVTVIGSQERRILAILAGLELLMFIVSLKQGSLVGSPTFLMFAIFICKYSKYVYKTRNSGMAISSNGL